MTNPLRYDKNYCSQNCHDCDTCSLVNYGRDCHGNAITKTKDAAAIPAREKAIPAWEEAIPAWEEAIPSREEAIPVVWSAAWEEASAAREEASAVVWSPAWEEASAVVRSPAASEKEMQKKSYNILLRSLIFEEQVREEK